MDHARQLASPSPTSPFLFHHSEKFKSSSSALTPLLSSTADVTIVEDCFSTPASVRNLQSRNAMHTHIVNARPRSTSFATVGLNHRSLMQATAVDCVNQQSSSCRLSATTTTTIDTQANSIVANTNTTNANTIDAGNNTRDCNNNDTNNVVNKESLEQQHQQLQTNSHCVITSGDSLDAATVDNQDDAMHNILSGSSTSSNSTMPLLPDAHDASSFSRISLNGYSPLSLSGDDDCDNSLPISPTALSYKSLIKIESLISCDAQSDVDCDDDVHVSVNNNASNHSNNNNSTNNLNNNNNDDDDDNNNDNLNACVNSRMNRNSGLINNRSLVSPTLMTASVLCDDDDDEHERNVRNHWQSVAPNAPHFLFINHHHHQSHHHQLMQHLEPRSLDETFPLGGHHSSINNEQNGLGALRSSSEPPLLPSATLAPHGLSSMLASMQHATSSSNNADVDASSDLFQQQQQQQHQLQPTQQLLLNDGHAAAATDCANAAALASNATPTAARAKRSRQRSSSTTKTTSIQSVVPSSNSSLATGNVASTSTSQQQQPRGDKKQTKKSQPQQQQQTQQHATNRSQPLKQQSESNSNSYKQHLQLNHSKKLEELQRRLFGTVSSLIESHEAPNASTTSVVKTEPLSEVLGEASVVEANSTDTSTMTAQSCSELIKPEVETIKPTRPPRRRGNNQAQSNKQQANSSSTSSSSSTTTIVAASNASDDNISSKQCLNSKQTSSIQSTQFDNRIVAQQGSQQCGDSFIMNIDVSSLKLQPVVQCSSGNAANCDTTSLLSDSQSVTDNQLVTSETDSPTMNNIQIIDKLQAEDSNTKQATNLNVQVSSADIIKGPHQIAIQVICQDGTSLVLPVSSTASLNAAVSLASQQQQQQLQAILTSGSNQIQIQNLPQTQQKYGTSASTASILSTPTSTNSSNTFNISPISLSNIVAQQTQQQQQLLEASSATVKSNIIDNNVAVNDSKLCKPTNASGLAASSPTLAALLDAGSTRLTDQSGNDSQSLVPTSLLKKLVGTSGNTMIDIKKEQVTLQPGTFAITATSLCNSNGLPFISVAGNQTNNNANNLSQQPSNNTTNINKRALFADENNNLQNKDKKFKACANNAHEETTSVTITLSRVDDFGSNGKITTGDGITCTTNDTIVAATNNNKQTSTDSNQPFRCEHCNSTFTRLGNFTRHKKIHTVPTKDGQRFRCDVCSKSFLQRCDLARHLHIHRGTEPHRCNICGKGYIRHSDLVTHQRFHNKEKPFGCPHCSKGFCQRGDLNRHLRSIHLQMKPILCPCCNRKFAKQETLLRHLNAAHRGKTTNNSSQEQDAIPPIAVISTVNIIHQDSSTNNNVHMEITSPTAPR